MQVVYDSTYYPYTDKTLFFKKCDELIQKIPNIVKGKLLQDVDDSYLQLFTLNGKEIIIFNDEEVGAVYIQSEIDLAPFLENTK